MLFQKCKIFVIFLISLQFISSASADDAHAISKLVGKVSNVQFVEAVRKPDADLQTDIMGNMFGIFGALFADFMSTEVRAYNVYTIKIDEVKSIQIANRSSYKAGDCLSLSYPAEMGEAPYFDIDSDVSIQRSSDCIEE
jgi:hypothetical protein